MVVDALVEVKDYELKVLGVRIEILMFRKVKHHVSLPPSYFLPPSSTFLLSRPFSLFIFFFDIQTTQTLSSLLRTSRIFKVNATVDRWQLTVEQLVTMAVVVRKKSLVG